MFRLGFIVNPYAGIGGPTALKGSDGLDPKEIEVRFGISSKSNLRATEFLKTIGDSITQLRILTCSGDMGESAVKQAGANYAGIVYDQARHDCSTCKDTQNAAKAILAEGVDLLVFVGGDGTARDICSAVGDTVPVLGIPAGVKMHSGVFAVTPGAGALLIQKFLTQKAVDVALSEVRDIDEAALRAGQIKTRHYGELLTPQCDVCVQAVKCGGADVEALILDDIGAYVLDELAEVECLIIGAGKTTYGIKTKLSETPTLLGIDVYRFGQQVAADVCEDTLFNLVSKAENPMLVLSLTGGQGALLGRGNQQISPRILKIIGVSNIKVIATRDKLMSLNGRSLIIDTGDAELDQIMAGYYQVIVGYDQRVLYPAGFIK